MSYYLSLNGNLAHAYLLSGEYQAAKAMYLQFNGQKFPDGCSWQEVTLKDFNELKKHGIEHLDFKKIAKEVFGLDRF